MTIYNGTIGTNYLRAEVSFSVSLPEFCEDQQFKLFEETSEGNEYFNDFELLLNSRKNIITAEGGIASYTGSIEPTEIDTIVIAQVKIEPNQVNDFPNRTFKLVVL